MRSVILSALSAAAAIISSSNPASAVPSSGAAVLNNAVATRFEAVQSSRRWWLPYRYYGGPAYYRGPAYYGDGPYYGPGPSYEYQRYGGTAPSEACGQGYWTNCY